MTSQFYTSKWDGMIWMVVQIPIKDRPIVEAVCDKYNLRLADGIPIMLSGGKAVQFPLSGDNVWSLESHGKPPEGEEENQLIDAIHRDFKAMCYALVGTNIDKEMIEVEHSSLRSIPGDSTSRKFCPTCLHGHLLVSRTQEVLSFKNINKCDLCGQTVRYTGSHEV